MDMTKKCATCGAEYGESTRFCSRCGSNQFTPLMAAAPAAMKRCAQCGAECKPEARFCSTCGCGNFVAVAPIPVPAPTPIPVPPPDFQKGQRKLRAVWILCTSAVCLILLLGSLFFAPDKKSPSKKSHH